MLRARCFKTLTVFLVIVTLLALLPTASAAAAPEDNRLLAQTGPYATAIGSVSVRGGPGPGFWILATLNNGGIVPILNISPDGGWWYVNTTNGAGWVAQASVTASNAANVTVLDPGPIGTVTAGVVNVRFGAGQNALALGQISAGQQVLVLARNADASWLQVQWAYGTGWVAASLLTVTGLPAAIIDDEAALPLTTDAPYVLIMATYLNIRSGPGINYAVLGQAYGGETLPIVGRTADSAWYQVESRFGTGWVHSLYVVTRNEYGGTPVTTSTAATADVAGPFGIINTGALHIRSGPGTQYDSLGTLAGGVQTQIVGRNADWSWWLLDTPIGTGWANVIYILVRGDTAGVPYVAPGTTAPASPGYEGGTAPQPIVAGPVAFVVTGALNIRSGPNAVFPSLGTVYAGTRMPIIGQSPDLGWWYVDSTFGQGYISKLYVIAEGDTSGVLVIQ